MASLTHLAGNGVRRTSAGVLARVDFPQRSGRPVERVGEFRKTFFIIAGGKESAPTSAAEMMSLYREGRLRGH